MLQQQIDGLTLALSLLKFLPVFLTSISATSRPWLWTRTFTVFSSLLWQWAQHLNISHSVHFNVFSSWLFFEYFPHYYYYYYYYYTVDNERLVFHLVKNCKCKTVTDHQRNARHLKTELYRRAFLRWSVTVPHLRFFTTWKTKHALSTV